MQLNQEVSNTGRSWYDVYYHCGYHYHYHYHYHYQCQCQSHSNYHTVILILLNLLSIR